MQTFPAEILKDTAGRLTYLPLPFSAREIFHQPKGTIYVQGTINGIPYRSRLLSRGSGCYIMLIDKVLQKSLGFCGLPLPVSVTMSLDAPAQPSGSPAAPSPSLSPCAMDTITAVKTRTSVRHYTDAPITPDALNTLLYAGMCAPSAKNKRPWHFLLLEDRNLLTELSATNPNARMLAGAACGIVVCGDRNIEGTNDFLCEACAAATQNILLCAHSLALGAVWCGVLPHSPWQKLLTQTLNLPPKVSPIIVIALGHPAPSATSPEKAAPWDPAKLHRATW